MFRRTSALHWLTTCALAALVIATPVTPVLAQSATGSIEGSIVDQTGAAMPGVTVTIIQTATGVTRTAVSDDNGLFHIPLLPVGVYDVTADLSGFSSRKLPELMLTVGQTVTLRIQMAVSGIAETVNVSGGTPILETSRSEVSSTITESSVQNLPVNGRNFIDFALLTPGVTRDVRTGDISFAGQRGTLNSLVVDGADNNNTFFGQTVGRTGSGRAPYQFSQDAVKEFQVNSNSFSAEYGRAGGAVINVVTKSGTNDLHGSAFEFYRDQALNANNVINVLNNRPKSPYHYNQFGGTLGGPIRPNRDFFFFNYDGQRNTQPNVVFLNLPSNTPTDAATQAGIALLEPLADSWNRALNQDVFLIKTDHELTDTNRLSFRYNQQNFTGEGFENGGPQNSSQHTGASLVKTNTFNGSWTSIFGTTVFNELRFQWARDKEPGIANSVNPEAVVQQSGTTVLTIGRNNFSPRETTIKRWQVADTVTWLRGQHKLKGGFDFQFDDILNNFPGFFSGSYTFRTLASFAGGQPNGANEFYQQNFRGAGTTGPETHPNIHEYSVFVQDEWRLRTALTINMGLRYDLMKTAPPPVRNPDPQLAAADIDTSRLDADTNNWGPRLGVAWSPGNSGKYVARGGWGLFYGRTPSIMLGTAHSNNGINIVSLTFTGDTVPKYPANFSEIPNLGTPARPSIFYVDNDFANSRLMQANLAFEWEVHRNTSLTATYLFVDGADLPRSIDRNLGSPSVRTFTVAGSGATYPYQLFGTDRPFTNFTRVIGFEASAESRYHGITFELNRRMSNHLQYRAAYTLGKVEDTVPDATAVVPGNAGDDVKYASNPVNFDADRTAGNNDQRHRLVLSGIYDTIGVDRLQGFMGTLVRNWSFSLIFTAQSGQPYTARVGAVDLNGDGNTRNDIAPGTVRNQFRLSSLVTFDPRIARDIPIGPARLQLIWEAFNLFNRDNINGVDTTYYSVVGTTLTSSTTFGRPLSSSGERIMQLAAKFTF